MQFLLGVLQNAAWALVGVIALRVAEVVRTTIPLRRLWRLTDARSVTICAAISTQTYTGIYVRPATGIGQVQALALVAGSLSAAYGKLSFKNTFFATEPLAERLENDLILLGGGKNNQVTARFLDLLKNDQPVLQRNDVFIWRRQDHDTWTEENAEQLGGDTREGKVVRDYGIVIRARSPFTSNKRMVIMFAGAHTYGVTAAARYFTENMHKEFARRLLRQNLAAVVSAEVVDGYPTNVRLERRFAWQNKVDR